MTPAELREMVPVMRELGVTQCDGIVLGPAPLPMQPTVTEPAPAPPFLKSLPDAFAEALASPDVELSPEDQKEVDAYNEWRRGAAAQ